MQRGFADLSAGKDKHTVLIYTFTVQGWINERNYYVVYMLYICNG